MFVRREGSKQATLLHQHEARAVNETPFLVSLLSEKLPRLFIQDRVNMNDLDVWRSFETTKEQVTATTESSHVTQRQRSGIRDSRRTHPCPSRIPSCSIPATH